MVHAAKKPNKAMDNLLGQIWIKAHEAPTDDPVRLTFNTKVERMTMRTTLYNFSGRVQKNPQDYPAKVLDAINGCSIVAEGDTGMKIVRRIDMPGMRSAIEQLGLTLGTDIGKGQLDAEAEASAKRMVEKLGQAGAAGKYLGRD